MKYLTPFKCRDMMIVLEKLKLNHQGRHHSGIDDVRNIANILRCLLEGGIGIFDSDIVDPSIRR